jgi:hypothetical protein
MHADSIAMPGSSESAPHRNGAKMLKGQRVKTRKLLCVLLTLAAVPAALAGNNAPLQKDKVAEFVAEKLDVTTLPASIRPKPQKNKKTFSDYGYVMR